MKTKLYKKIFAFVFLAMMLGFAVFNVKQEKGTILYDIKELEKPKNIDELQVYNSQIDNILTENIAGGHAWNELYGSVYQSLGKNEENNFKYVKDKNGFLYSGNFWNTSNIDAREIALRMYGLQEAVQDNGTEVISIMYPTKYNEEWSDGYYGIPYNNLNTFADSVLLYMRRYNVEYIDFREVFLEKGKTMDDMFYKTDHHWTVPTAFEATGVIIDHLKTKHNDDWDPDGYYMNIDNYVVEKYENIYLGSQGRETGIEYGSLDDYTYIYPNFETEYTYTGSYREGQTFSKHGDTLKTLVSKKYLDYSDAYEREMNNSYMQGVCLTDQIVNELNPEGKKILFIRDSYSSPIATFLAPMCSEIDMMWALYVDEEEVVRKIKSEEYDYIFVALAIDNFIDEGFPFYKDTKRQKSSEE